jgi:hypothetical protein
MKIITNPDTKEHNFSFNDTEMISACAESTDNRGLRPINRNPGKAAISPASY